ncbi:MAG: PEP/pyruvate-binding domain-containing protein [Pseudomonadota bacterium]|nr:PEP/pyruvate-binding domain-containing protein [Pseudomonadota bacterium]
MNGSIRRCFPWSTLAAGMVCLLSGSGVLAGEVEPAGDPLYDEYRRWIGEMKTSDRGPFARIRWFCNDGTVLPPKAYACAEHGGGHQHGEWTEKTRELRAQGYLVATLLAGSDPEKLVADAEFVETWNQLLIERFLMAVDNGWIMRHALFYRGAIQEEDERAAARALLTEMAGQPEWIGLRYPSLRTGVRVLPHGEDTASVQKVRQLSASLSDQDANFKGIRSKIHGAPDKDDAGRVRDYAAGVTDAALVGQYEELANEIDQVYEARPLPQRLRQHARRFTTAPWLQTLLLDAAEAVEQDDSAGNVYTETSTLLADLRDALPRIRQASARLTVLDLGLAVEAGNFRAGTVLRDQMTRDSRHEHVELLTSAVNGAYGVGMINLREREALQETLSELEDSRIPLSRYMDDLRYLARIPGWGTQGLRFQFHESMQKLAQIEPDSLLFIQDQLRGSPLLFYSQVLDSLQRDANQLAGVTHRLFGQKIGVGFRALNPGLARGVLHVRPDSAEAEDFLRNGIYVLPETVSDLPPISGIITAGEGNPLSHIQLLARNLGIPNISVDETLILGIDAHDGESVVLAVSPAGLVELSDDGPRWDAVFGEEGEARKTLIRPDLEKLDLGVREFVALDDLGASDSGRIVGPKAAKLGELRRHFPGAVAPGVAIPFGLFRETVLDKPYRDSDRTVFEWMVSEYGRLQAMPAGSKQREEQTGQFRAELHDLILNTRLDEDFRNGLRQALEQGIGPVGSYGVFVRSDTNVEDLPGFTGAGLNLTLPNVVGMDDLLEAIPTVWASPFTARAFAWRQSLMADPENVYPAVLLLKSVPNDKSGVMVTRDIDTGDMDVLSVAVNEGVGGAVDGQSAESLRIDTRDGSVRLLASATAVWRRVPAANGGVARLPVSGDLSVLKPDEISQLVSLARELPNRFPPITDDDGNPAPADIEFGFLDGRLQLFQLRPFLESRDSRGADWLSDMDESLRGKLNKTVDMAEVPGS